MICPKCKKDLGQINPWEQGRCPYCNYDLSNYDPYAPSKTPSTTENLSGGVGDSITGLGKTVCAIGIIASFILGIIFLCSDEHLVVVGFLVVALGSFLSWLSTLLLRGFGQLVSDTAIIRQLLQNRK